MNKNYKTLERYGHSILDTVESKSALECMVSERGNFYHIILPMFADCEQISVELRKLLPEDDRKIKEMACFLHPWCLDFPSYNFRKTLCKLNGENSETAIYVCGKGRVISKKLSETMPSESDKAYDKQRIKTSDHKDTDWDLK